MSPGVEPPRRRPPGWCAPGPPPAVPVGRPELWPQPGEDLSCLTGDWRILQPRRGHRWSLDDLVTAWMAICQTATAPPARVIDLGCGIGAVLLMLAWRFPAARGIGVEAQPASVALARRSAAWNGALARCEVRRADLRDAEAVPEGPVFDLVTGTPPYLPLGTGRVPERALQAPCHLEYRGGIEAYCDAAQRLLTPDGRFVVCHGATQTARVEGAARAAGLTIGARLDVVPRAGKAPLFSVFAMQRAAGSGVVSKLTVRDGHGQWTEEFSTLRREMGMPVLRGE